MKFSVVIPVYNSSKSIGKVIDEVRHYFLSSDVTYEIILVDDGSDSETKSVLENILSGSELFFQSDVKCISLDGNVGQQRALLKGLMNATGEYAVTIDDDLQHDISELSKLYACAKAGSDLVFGVYSSYGEKKSREFGSKLIGLFFKVKYRKLAGARVSSYRLIHNSVYRHLKDSANQFVYLSASLLPYSKRVGNVVINRRSRLYGKSGYTLSKCIGIGIKLIYFYGLRPSTTVKGVQLLNEKIAHGRRG